MHTFYKVLQKNTLRKKICVFLCALCTASLVVLSNANAAEYICTTKVYVSCEEGYYLSDCGEVDKFSSIGGDSDSCKSCPDQHSCAGGTACPKRTTLDVECTEGQYIQKNATECSACPAGSFCKGGTYTIAAGGATEAVGATACAKGSYSAAGASTCTACDGGKTTSGTGQTSCQACSNNANVATWVATSWSSNNTVSNLCTVDTCSAGSIKGNNQCTQCEAGTVSSGGTATSCTECAAGTYQDEIGKSSCKDCTGRAKYSATKKATSCSDVSRGYYTTGCDNSGNKCTGQAQCTGATYCSGGVQNNCPDQSNGWERKGGDGWTQVSQCYQIRNATTISEYCSAGQLKQTGKDSTSWNPTSVPSAFNAKPGSYVSGSTDSLTCKQCEAGTVSSGGTATSCTPCGTGKYQGNEGQSSCNDCGAIGEGFKSWVESSGLTEDKCPFTCNENYTPNGRKCASCSTTQACPNGYSGTYNSCEKETQYTQDRCYIECTEGTYVAVEEGACTAVPSTAKGYATPHTVAYGAKSPTLSPCPGGATGNDEGASEVTDCYKDCPETKTINNGTTTFASGHVYYLSSTGNYDNDRCSYTVNCNERYGANSTEATKNPSCTWCENGYYSGGGNSTCKSCTNAPDTHATYTTNGTTNNDCGWQCNAGYFKDGTSCTSCPDGSTAVPVTSIAGANDTIQGCFISPLVNNNPTKITDSTGTFKYKSGATSYCYHN